VCASACVSYRPLYVARFVARTGATTVSQRLTRLIDEKFVNVMGEYVT